MNRTRTRPLTPLVAVAAVAVLAAGCTGTSTADPTLPPDSPSDTTTPTTSPTPTPTDTPSPSPASNDTPMPTDDQLVGLVNAYRNITLDLPPTPVDQAQEHINEAAAELTTPDGSARESLQGSVGETGLIVRGRPYTAILDQPQPDGPEWTATACVATQGQNTLIESGDPAEEPLAFTSEYTEADVRVAPDEDGGWLLDDYTQPDDPQDHIRCAPPDVVDAVHTNWERTNQLATEWTAAGQTSELLEPLEPLLTPSNYESLQDMVGSGTITRNPDVEIEYGFEVVSVRPETDAIARWCQDATRDPTARATNSETGEVTDLSEQEAAIVTAKWTYSGDGWRRGANTGSRVAQEGEAPCD